MVNYNELLLRYKSRDTKDKTNQRGVGEFIKRFAGWIVNEEFNDYGMDFEVRISVDIDRKMQDVQLFTFYSQLKSTDVVSEESSYDFKVSDLLFFENQDLPVLLARYFDGNSKLYYVIAQEYIWDILDIEDYSWRSQRTKVVKFEKEVNDLEEIREALMRCRARIIRMHLHSLKIGEGFSFSSPSSLDALIENKKRYEKEGRALSLHEAHLRRKDGDSEGEIQIYKTLIINPEDSYEKLLAYINLEEIYVRKNNELEFKDIIQDGLILAKNLKEHGLGYFQLILASWLNYSKLHKKIAQSQIRKKSILLGNSDPLALYYEFQFYDGILETIKNVNEKINSALNYLWDNSDHMFITGLSIVIRIFVQKTSILYHLDSNVIEEIKISAKIVVDILESYLKYDFAPEFKIDVLYDLGIYYYHILEYDLAIDKLERAIEIAEETKNLSFMKYTTVKKQTLIDNPNPYEAIAEKAKSSKKLEELSGAEYKEDVVNLITQLDLIDLSDVNDEITKSVLNAIDDLDRTEIYRHCEFLRIRQISTSILGHQIQLETLGPKVIWCKHGQDFPINISLKHVFRIFKSSNCTNCSHHTPRDQNWKYTINDARNLEIETDFKKFWENIRF
ncbi:MAG: hypothetical protein HeimC2_28250 [Candidatus Heimdallarchaeota archaeon LC_2]|nr:MAG: hypothetical protein HeimC2_28250 [Candidatus Heimdallarchaeota archaeon LC_2]